jgi:twitching motility protein PilT
MQSSGDLGMLTFDQHLLSRLQEGLITSETAMELAHVPEEFRRLARA